METTDRDAAYWDPERASYEDELDAWRERTARPARFARLESPTVVPGHAVIGGLFGGLRGPMTPSDVPVQAQSLFGTPPDEVLAA